MASQVDICNAALVKLGQGTTIAAITERSAAAVIFNRCWSRILDEVLEAQLWPFATRAEPLALVNEPAFPGWAYRYARPDDCMTVIAVCDANGVRPALSRLGGDPRVLADVFAADPRVAFDTVYGEQQTCLVTDLADAWVIYSARVESTTRFPPSFVEALACRLAMEAAPPLAGELGLRLLREGVLQQGYLYALSTAGAHGFNEYRDTAEAVTPSMAARG